MEGHAIEAAGITLSPTVTSTKFLLPVLVTSKVTNIDDPTSTPTPGAAFASSALIFLITEMPGAVDVALAGSESVTGAYGSPVNGSIIGFPSG